MGQVIPSIDEATTWVDRQRLLEGYCRALYEFEAGVVFRKGDRFEFAVRPAGAERAVERLSFYQELAEWRDFEHLVPGDKTRVVYWTATAAGRYR